MDDVELTQFFAREYHIQRQKTEDPFEKDLQMQDTQAGAVLGMAQPLLPVGTRHLDIGSSIGALLQCFHQQYGCANVGVEPTA